MRRTDRWVGAALAVLGGAVSWSARAFPNVPGQKVGAGFLPMLVGAGLVACGALLVARGFRAGGGEAGSVAAIPADPSAGPSRLGERIGGAIAVIAAVVAYILLADRLGFLIVAPAVLAMLFVVLRVKPLHALLWAVVGTAVVHFAFYKLLRVPLPWGVLRPFY